MPFDFNAYDGQLGQHESQVGVPANGVRIGHRHSRTTAPRLYTQTASRRSRVRVAVVESLAQSNYGPSHKYGHTKHRNLVKKATGRELINVPNSEFLSPVSDAFFSARW